MCETVSLVLEGMSAQPPLPLAAIAERYCHLLMEASPGLSQVSLTSPSPALAVKPMGLPGTAIGVALASSDSTPLPLAFTARNLNV